MAWLMTSFRIYLGREGVTSNAKSDKCSCPSILTPAWAKAHARHKKRNGAVGQAAPSALSSSLGRQLSNGCRLFGDSAVGAS